MNKKMIGAGLLALALISQASVAEVTSAQASALGKTLTPVGAEMKGNKAGTIPSWTGGQNSSNTPASADKGRPDNIFKNDKPVFEITSSNYTKYEANLSAGQVAMFKKFPTYKMPVYKTQRTAAYPQDLYATIKKNATTAKLVNNGDGVDNFDLAIPFPIPQNGVEVIWNHITRFRGGSVVRTGSVMPVQQDGSYITVKMSDRLVFPEFLKGGRHSKKDDNVLFYYLQRITAPARLTGTSLLVHETMDQVKEPRRAWVYNSGQRRVRRAPNVAYDGPGAGTDGLRTSDNYDMYNGSPDRYNWKLVGKKEMYIPYNAYKLLDTNTKYADIVKAGHLNSDHLRYELHRVWQVEAELKDNARHIYSKRTFYIDEDTWAASVIDQYDSRGVLWKLSEGHNVQFYDVNAPWLAAETLHDLNSGRYLVTGLSNEEPRLMVWGGKASRREFTSSALRRLGR
ncbi:MAG: DUF1329 domain-containing protein [Bermanella sp.]